MRIRKNMLMLSLIALFLMSVAVVPSYSQGATLSVDPLETVQASGTFWIDIYVDDVEKMWGFYFKLVYDADVLTATDFYSEYPFETAQGPWGTDGGEINDVEGYVEMAFSYPMGEEDGLTTDAPVLIASIEFSIDALGASPLQIEDSDIADVLANLISHTAMCGEFRTTAGLPMAKFASDPEMPVEGEEVTFTSYSTDSGTSIIAWDWDFGDGNTGTGAVVTHTYTETGDYEVTLTVTDDDANTDSQSAAMAVSKAPPPGAELLNAYTYPTVWYYDFYSRWTNTTYLRAWVENLDTEEPVLVRVLFYVYNEAGANIGTLEVEGTVEPRTEGRRRRRYTGIRMFKVAFDVTDPSWEFAYEEANRTNQVTKEWTFRAECWYNDFDLPDTGEPHWTQYPSIDDATEIEFTLTAIAGGWVRRGRK